MFERLRRLFRRRESQVDESGGGAPDPFGTPFQPGLPRRMAESHAALRAALELAQDGEQRGEADRVRAHLGALDQLLRAYLAEPEAAFHGYMSERLARDSARLQVLRSVRARLRLLSKEVRDVVQPRRDGAGRATSPMLGRTLREWAATLRDSLADLERDLLPLYVQGRAGD